MQLVFFCSSLIWGIDYLIPLHETVLIDFLKAHALPLWLWGLILINTAITGLVSELWLRKRFSWGWGVSWGAHLLLACLYFSFAGGAFLQLIWFPSSGTIKGLVDYIQTPLSCGLIAYVHWQFSKRMDFVRETGDTVDTADWRHQE